MPAHQYRDDNDKVAPVFRRKDGGASNIPVTVAGGAQLIAVSKGTKIVSFWSEGTVYIKFGDNTIVANGADHALPAGIIDYEPLVDTQGKVVATYISVFATTDTIFHLSERE